MDSTSSKFIKATGFSKAKKKLPTRLSQYRRMVNEAAYYRSKQRGFIPGYELLDWLKAEEEILCRLFHIDAGDGAREVERSEQ